MKQNPKKLNLNEMWTVYQLIGDSVSNPIQEKLIDEMIAILGKSSHSAILKTLNIFWGKVSKTLSGIDVAINTTKAIKRSNFLKFVEFIRTI